MKEFFEYQDKMHEKAIVLENEFQSILQLRDTEKLKSFFSEKVDLEMLFFYNSCDNMIIDRHPFFYSVVATKDQKIIDCIIDNPKYEKDMNFFKSIHKAIPEYFLLDCEKDDVELLKTYDVLNDKVKSKLASYKSLCQLTNSQMSLIDVENFGLDLVQIKQENGTFIKEKAVINAGFGKAVNSSYDGTDILDFFIDRQEKYGYKCKFVNYDIFERLSSGLTNKADYIMDKLSLTYKEVLIEAYDYFKKYKQESLNKVMEYLIIEKEVPLDNDIKAAIKDDTVVQNIFLFKNLTGNLPVTEDSKKKPKI